MIKSVNQAFKEFEKRIKLTNKESENAIKSRDWLIENIKKFPKKDDSFPKLYNEKNLLYGSFARKTKIKPLDDIDLMICISAEGSKYIEADPDNIDIKVPDNTKNLFNLSDENLLNSRKVIEKFKSNLINIEHYSQAEINRRQEAVTLKLSSYKWNFDIVPCFFTKPESDGRSYYLIPNGEGKWKKTNPIVDRDRINRINQRNNGKILDIIRIFKSFKFEKNLNMSSYLMEVIILNYYENYNYIGPINTEINLIFNYLTDMIKYGINDPQNIRDNINNLDLNQRDYDNSILTDNSRLSYFAEYYYQNDNAEKAIQYWREIFGINFPNR